MFDRLVGSFVDFVRGGAESAILMLVRMITNSFLPNPELLSSQGLLLYAGGMLGLATMLAVLLLVAMSVVMIITATRDHSRRISKAITSVFYLLVFQFLFLPIFSMAHALSVGLAEAQINLVADSPEPESLIAQMVGDLPQDTFTAFMMFPIVVIFSYMASFVAVAINGMTITVYVLYPLAIAVRMIGWTYPFNVFNAALISALSAPPLMAFGILLPLLVGIIPMPDVISVFVQLLVLVIGLVFAVVAPCVVFFMAFFKSSEVFGRVDATVAGKVDIGSMPIISTEQYMARIEDANDSSGQTFAQAALADAITLPVDLDYSSKEAFFGSLGHYGADAAATGFSATGHHYAAIAVKVAEKALNDPD